uniref:Kinectin n=1 Tax=Loa loa TaxID=7209 RepID=A0A1I7VI66_LOALO
MNKSANLSRGEENEEQMIKATLSGSMPNIRDVQDSGNRSADRSNLMNDSISSGSSKAEGHPVMKSKGSEEKATRKSHAEAHLINMGQSSTFPRRIVLKKQETTPKKEAEASIKMLPLTTLSPLFPRSTVSMKQESTPKTEVEKKQTKSEMQEKPAVKECANCHIMHTQLSDVNAKGDVGKSQEVASTVEFADSSEEVNQWKAHCAELTSKLKILQTEMMQQMSTYQLKMDEALNEREVVLAKLTKAREKVSSLEMALEHQKERNIALSNVIQDMELKSIEKLEKQKEELMHTAGAEFAETDKLYRSSQNKITALEAMLKKANCDNEELRRRLDSTTDDLKNVKFGGMEPEELDRRLEKKLNSLMEKFKAEAQNPDLAWVGEENVRNIMDGFEVIVKVILEKEPHLEQLAEQLAAVMEIKKGGESEPVEPSDIGKEGNVEEKAFKDFKTEMSAEIEAIMEKYHVKQTNDLSESVCKIMDYLGRTEQKVDASVVKRIDELNDLLLVIDSKQNDLQATEERMNGKLENLSETVEDIGNRANFVNEGRLTEFWRERHSIKAALSYVEQLGGDQMKLENRLRNMEMQYARLEEEIRNESIRPMAYIRETSDKRHDTSRKVGDYSDMMEWPPAGRYWGSTGYKKEDENRGQRRTAHHGAGKEIPTGIK